LRKSAGKVQEDQVASEKFFPQISFGEEFFNPAGAVAGKNQTAKWGRTAPTNLSGTKVGGISLLHEGGWQQAYWTSARMLAARAGHWWGDFEGLDRNSI